MSDRRLSREVPMKRLLLVLMLVCSAALRGAGDTQTPMKVTGAINLITKSPGDEFSGDVKVEVAEDELMKLLAMRLRVLSVPSR